MPSSQSGSESEPISPPPPGPNRGKTLLRVGIALGILALVVFGGRSLGAYIPRFAAWVNGLGAWGPVVFIGGYALAAVAFVPGSVLTLAAGAIFGLVRGVVYAFLGATLGAALAFLVSRHLARSAVERRLAGNERFAAVDRAIGESGGRIVFLLRLSPLFPYNLTNYAMGLTRVRFVPYLLASLGMLPGALLYVYYGKLAGDVAAAAGGSGVKHDTRYYVVLALGLAATIAVTAVVTRIARKALREATGA
jgi:uncharacterized membrane protein YdjX (TVP38/TMEM64 family)